MKTAWLRSSLALFALLFLLGALGCDAVVKQLVTTEPVAEEYKPPERPAPFTATRGTPSKEMAANGSPREFAPPEPRRGSRPRGFEPPRGDEAPGTGGGAGETVLLDFQAEWCGPCKRMHPLVQNLATRGFPVRQIDIDAYPALARKYGVSSIPCFVLVVDGQEVERVVGAVPLSRLEGMFTRHRVAAR